MRLPIMRYVISSLLVFSTLYTPCNILYAQDTMHWSPNRMLSWTDFKDTDTRGLRTTEMACTTSGIAIDIHSSDNRHLFVTIYTLFYPYKSLTKTDSSAYLLKHEQDHFDLAELYARKMRKEIMALSPTSKNAVTEVRAIYNKYNDALNKAQLEYDAETDHSINSKVQQQWNTRIAAELKQYAAYAKPQLELKMQ